MAKTLLDYVKMDETEYFVEESLHETDITVNKGFHLEIYGNPEGKFDEESSEGSSMFVFIDENISYGKLLEIFSDMGSVKDGTLTIRVVGIDETEEREMCKENPISNFLHA